MNDLSRRPPRPRPVSRKPSYPRCVGIGLSAGMLSLLAACGSSVEVENGKGGSGGSTTSGSTQTTGPGGGLMGVMEDPWDGGGAAQGGAAGRGGAGGIGGGGAGAGGEGARNSSGGGLAGVPEAEFDSG